MANAICSTCGSTEQKHEPMQKCYPLVSQGFDKEMDILGVCVQALNELDDLQRSSVVTYLANRFGVLRVSPR